MSEAEDTDVLLALLCSLLDGPNPTQDVLLSALADADGDVERAAGILNSSKPSTVRNIGGKKRKRRNDLNSWIVNKKQVVSNHEITKKEGLPFERGSNAATDGAKESSLIPVYIGSDDEDDHEHMAVDRAVARKEGGVEQATKDEDGHQVIMENTERAKKMKNISSLMTVLKPPPSSPKRPPKLLPRTLATPTLVAQHTPCTMHPSILPPELASELFYAMLGEATDWSRNKWWLFDRVVESPHRTSFYARNLKGDLDKEDDMQEAAKYWYNGRPTAPPRSFLPQMEAACEIIERVVNEEIRKRGTLYPLEWPSTEEHPWRANVAAANCYTGPFESYCPIDSHPYGEIDVFGTLSDYCIFIIGLGVPGTSRMFRLREVIPQSERDERNAQTFNIPVTHNSLLIMHASCQERFKHCVPPQQTIDAFKPPFPPPPALAKQGDKDDQMEMMPPDTSRINITFRFYRPDFAPKSIPRCHCGVPTILRPDMKGLRRKQEDFAGIQGEIPKMDSKFTRETAAYAVGSSGWNEVVTMRYFWMCYAGAQNDGKGCNFFQLLDYTTEGRGTSML
ncbi:hypothetical protein FRC17_007751 [Serendipita sp. 399]|nr:hypothetical protein FRC17_007751 [Serendipita sp. 399]